MTEVFKIDGETLESVQQALHECKSKILGGKPASTMLSKDNSLKDVEVEVISYRDNYIGELSESEVIVDPLKLLSKPNGLLRFALRLIDSHKFRLRARWS